MNPEYKDVSRLKMELRFFFESISKINFTSSYEPAIAIIKSYKDLGLSKPDAVRVLSELDNELEMNPYQEDVFLELSNVVGGFSSDIKNIKW